MFLETFCEYDENIQTAELRVIKSLSKKSRIKK